MPVFPILAIVLITLKLIGTIALSWWWIAAIWLAPLLFVLALGALGLAGFGSVLGGMALYERFKERRRPRGWR